MAIAVLNCWPKKRPLNFDFTKTLPTSSVLVAQRRFMAYSKACFLSYKMCYDFNLKLLSKLYVAYVVGPGPMYVRVRATPRIVPATGF